VSLFGVAVSAAELPTMANIEGADVAGLESLRRRLDVGLRRIAFFVIPSAMASGTRRRGGGGSVEPAAFAMPTRYVGILAGSAIGLLAQTLGRSSSTYYALRDTRTPLRYAPVRVALTTALVCAFRRRACLGFPPSGVPA
jgi:putative peptidoglycan lipid II flippase